MASKDLVTGSLSQIAQAQNISLAESFLSADAIVIVDMSGSMSASDAPGGLSRYEAAENELIRLQGEFPGKIAVVAFSDDAIFCPTGIPIRLGGNTNMAKALRFVKPADGLARIILISDGEPDSASETLQVAGTFISKIDAVYIGPESRNRWSTNGREFLEKLAAASGGTFSRSKAPGLLHDDVARLLTATA